MVSASGLLIFSNRVVFMRLKINLYFIVAGALVILAACSTTPTQGIPPSTATIQVIESTATGEPSTPVVAPTVESTQAEMPYPSPTERIVPTDQPKSYPPPEAANSTPQVTYAVPEVTQDNGVVIGQLLDTNTGEPLAFQSVYLGVKIPLTPGPAYNYAIQEQSSPHTVSDAEGRFAMGDVKPGSYILMIYHPSSATVIMEPNSDRELEVIVTAGELLDLGPVKGIPPVQ